MLELVSVRSGYRGLNVLNSISLQVQEHKVTVIIGSNGAGKSTTLKTISGLLKPTEGSITFDGIAIQGMHPHLVARRGLVLVPEGRGIFGELTVRENLEMGSFNLRDRKDGIEEAVTLFPQLSRLMNRPGVTLSGGEQQMLAIARGLMAKPRLLMMDEPSMGLSPKLVEMVFSKVRDICAMGVTLLIVEQNAYQALSVADRAYVVERGSIATSGSGQDLLNDPAVKRSYLGTM